MTAGKERPHTDHGWLTASKNLGGGGCQWKQERDEAKRTSKHVFCVGRRTQCCAPVKSIYQEIGAIWKWAMEAMAMSWHPSYSKWQFRPWDG